MQQGWLDEDDFDDTVHLEQIVDEAFALLTTSRSFVLLSMSGDGKIEASIKATSEDLPHLAKAISKVQEDMLAAVPPDSSNNGDHQQREA